jgi:hypothetical protein
MRAPRATDRAVDVLRALPHDPFPALLGAADPAVALRTRRDLLGERIDSRALAALPRVSQISGRQQDDGRFR